MPYLQSELQQPMLGKLATKSASPPIAKAVTYGYGYAFLSLPVTFLGYLAASQALDDLLVEFMGFHRASSDAFGPFVTLLGLVYSILLGQIYTYYFQRQGVIQDALYQEIGALKLLAEATELLASRYEAIAERRQELVEILHSQAKALLARGLSAEVRLQSRSSLEMLTLLDALEDGCKTSRDGGTISASEDVRRLCVEAVHGASTARSTRISAIAAELPLIQSVAQRVITVVVLLGFVLVDLGAPKLEALLFSVTTGCFVLINVFLADLSDPFGGSWNVEPAEAELEEFVATLGASVRQREQSME